MRFYRALLHLYPASFRTEYGAEMRAIFARKHREVAGAIGWLWLWIGTLAETSTNAAAVHADILRQDLRVTARGLRRAPGFAFTAIVVLALGVGANTAAFSIADHVLVRPLPFRDPQRLVKLWESVPGYNRLELSPPNFHDWQTMSTSFEGMAAIRGDSVVFLGNPEPERIEGAAVTADLFPLLGAQPVLGRLLAPNDDREAAPGTLVLSEGLWKTRFGGDPMIVGRTVRLDSGLYTVIGVMPGGFHFPSRDAQFWTPMRFAARDFDDRDNNFLQAVARLKPGVSLAAARAEMRLVASQLEREYPKENQHTGANVLLLRDEISEQSRLLLLALCGAALCVLLIACANLANLQIARALMRQKELAVRTALGAGRERLVRQLLTEGLVLTLLGGLLGAILGIFALPELVRLVPDALPVAAAPSLDLRIFALAALLTAATGIGVGVIPAFRVCRRTDLTALHQGARAGGGRTERLRSALVAAEIAATVILLAGSGLFLRALYRLQAVDPGFRSEGVLTLRTALAMPKYEKTASRTTFYRRVLSDVRALPGVSSAAYISFLPLRMRGGVFPVSVAGRVETRSAADSVFLRFITPEYFQTMRIPFLQGRTVSESDSADRRFVAVVSASFVRRYWANQNPLGKHFQFAFHDRQVVGVVGDILTRGLDRSSEPQVYLPYQQAEDGEVVWYAPKDLAVRSSRNPAELVTAIRRIIAQADPEQPVDNVRLLSDIVGAETSPRALQLNVLAAFAALAFLLAAVGIHGVLSFAVSQRAREIGVRVALGARRGAIIAMVLRRGLLVTCAGIVPGLALAYAAARAMQSLLAGINPGDGGTFAAAAALCLIMTLAGSLWPAVRALSVDPITVMRSE